jgi:hypothetical protein
MHINHRGLTHLLPNAIASIATCSASHASSTLRCLCRSLRSRSFSFFVLPPPAGWGSGSVCCAPPAASAARGGAACTASSSVRNPMGRAGGALGRLLPCEELPWPLLPAPPLPALPLPLPIGCFPCGASAIPRARHDALNPCAMNTPSNRLPWSSARVGVKQPRTFL